MRRTSATNSHKLKDRDVAGDYCERNNYDEPLFWLGLRLCDPEPVHEYDYIGTVDQGNHWRPLELNHLWSLNRRPDFRSNFCRLLKPGHDWFGNNLPAGRVLCVLTKLRKREMIGESAEFDLAEIDKCAGKSVLGMIEGYDLPKWCEEYRSECVVRLAALALEQERA